MRKEDLLAYFNRPTWYEQQNGLEPRETWKLDRSFGDIEFYTRVSGNNSKTLLILLKEAPVTKPDDWRAWMISDPQARVLIEEFPELYHTLNDRNLEARKMRDSNTTSPEDYYAVAPGEVEW